jgi:single-strand DNA-binding protein
MASVNKVILIGNLGKDPEIRHISEGNAVANFSLATSESYKDKNGEWQENTVWHNIVAWRYLAEKAQRLKKGNTVYIEGKITNRSYDDKDGVKRYITEIVADTITSLTKREDDGRSEGGFNQGGSYSQGGSPRQEERTETAQSVNIEDDLPF